MKLNEVVPCVLAAVLTACTGVEAPTVTDEPIAVERIRQACAYDVADFGARAGDGVDDAEMIQDALDRAAEADGCVVTIPPGLYDVGTPLVVHSRTHVLGAGAGVTTLRGPKDTYPEVIVDGTQVIATIAAVAATHVTIEGLTIDHATNGTHANGVALIPDENLRGAPTTDSTVRNCEVLGFEAHEYLIWSMRGERIQIVDNRLDGNATGEGTDLGEVGIEMYGGHDVVIRGNQLRDLGSAAILVGAASPVVPDTRTFAAVISGNQIEGGRRGIVVHTGSDHGENPQDLFDIVVSNNLVRECHGWGVALHLESGKTAVHGVRFVANDIDGCEEGLHLQGFDVAEDHRSIEARGNTVRRATTTTTGGIYAASLSHVVIADNSVEGSQADGIRLVSLRSARIVGNTVTDSGARGIHLDAISDGELSDNRIDRAGGGGIQGVDTARLVVRRNHVEAIAANAVGILIGGGSHHAVVQDNTFVRAAAVGGYDAAVVGEDMVLTDNLTLYDSGPTPFANLSAP